MLYGAGGGAWGSPSRTAARLARQRELKDQETTLSVRQLEDQPIMAAPAPAAQPVSASPLIPSLQKPTGPDPMAQWLIPLGGGIVIGLGVASVYAWNRSRRMVGSASGRLLVVSDAAPASALPAHSPAHTHMGAIPKPPRRRVARSTRSVQSRMMSFPKLRIRASRDMYGDAVRQLQTLGVLPTQLRELTPGTGRPSWFANAITDEVQMYGGGSDPIPNYAYIEDASRMLAQVEHQKAAEALVWSNQRWQ